MTDAGSGRVLNILLLCDYQPRIAATVHDHIEALETGSRHRWTRLSMLGDIPRSVDLDRFDAVVVHYTLVASHERYLARTARQRLARFTGLKALFIQDEYRHVNASVDAMREIGIHVLFTCVPEHEIDKVYPSVRLPGVHRVNVLTGYVPRSLLARNAPPPSRRARLVGYRGRKLPAWLGRLGQEKLTIGVRFRDDARHYPELECDISFREEDRLYGEQWTEFVLRCRAMLGVESGASVFDFSGEIQRNVDRDVAENPALDYEELERRHFPGLDGLISLAQISPRCFESAALRTLMVLYPGEYSGRLVAWRHYIPLAKDHSNMQEVVRFLCDDARCDTMAQHAYDEVALAPENSYDGFASLVDRALEQALEPHMLSAGTPYGGAEFRRVVAFDLSSMRWRATRLVLTYTHYFVFRVLLGWASPEARDWLHGRMRSVYYALTFHRWRTRHR